MGGVEHGFHRGDAVLLLAAGDVPLGEIEIAQDRVGVGPLPEQIVVLEEMVVPEGRMRRHQGLQGHGVLFHQIDDAGVGIDDDLIGEAAAALAVVQFVMEEVLAEGPVAIHQRHADRGIGVEHLLGGDHLHLHRIDVEPQLLLRHRLDDVVGMRQGSEIPVRAGEQQVGSVCVPGHRRFLQLRGRAGCRVKSWRKTG